MTLLAKRKSTHKTTLKTTTPLIALKTVRKSGLKSKDDVDSALRERSTLAQLPWHPFVAGLYDTFQDRGNLYYALEYMPRGTLEDRIKLVFQLEKDGGMLQKDARFYFVNVALGLEFLHEKGIIHLDVKPENILIGPDGYLAIADFGLARHVSSLEFDDWTGLGTVSYMPPELDPRSGKGNRPHNKEEAQVIDWWALGCILYEMIMNKNVSATPKLVFDDLRFNFSIRLSPSPPT